MEKVNIKKYVLHCALIMLTGFFLLMVNVFYYQVIAADELAENPLNHRSSISNIVRGCILDSEGRELAVSYEAGSRQYPYGAIAAPKELPFGTQLEFDNQIWTVCDRGGYIYSYIDKNGRSIYRLDVFLPDHQECLERGRYITTAKIIVDK